jgi:hypothetical protein
LSGIERLRSRQKSPRAQLTLEGIGQYSVTKVGKMRVERLMEAAHCFAAQRAEARQDVDHKDTPTVGQRGEAIHIVAWQPEFHERAVDKRGDYEGSIRGRGRESSQNGLHQAPFLSVGVAVLWERVDPDFV